MRKLNLIVIVASVRFCSFIPNRRPPRGLDNNREEARAARKVVGVLIGSKRPCDQLLNDSYIQVLNYLDPALLNVSLLVGF